MHLARHLARPFARQLAERVLQVVGGLARLAAELLIRGYQMIISPLLIGNCKFVPSCSDYCLQAIRQWGVWRGAWMGLKRLARCHPFGIGGIDPVPDRPCDDDRAQGRAHVQTRH